MTLLCKGSVIEVSHPWEFLSSTVVFPRGSTRLTARPKPRVSSSVFQRLSLPSVTSAWWLTASSGSAGDIVVPVPDTGRVCDCADRICVMEPSGCDTEATLPLPSYVTCVDFPRLSVNTVKRWLTS